MPLTVIALDYLQSDCYIQMITITEFTFELNKPDQANRTC